MTIITSGPLRQARLLHGARRERVLPHQRRAQGGLRWQGAVVCCMCSMLCYSVLCYSIVYYMLAYCSMSWYIIVMLYYKYSFGGKERARSVGVCVGVHVVYPSSRPLVHPLVHPYTIDTTIHSSILLPRNVDAKQD